MPRYWLLATSIVESLSIMQCGDYCMCGVVVDLCRACELQCYCYCVMDAVMRL